MAAEASGRPLLPLLPAGSGAAAPAARPARLVTPTVLLRWLEPADAAVLGGVASAEELRARTRHASAFVAVRRADAQVLGLVVVEEGAGEALLRVRLLRGAPADEVAPALDALTGWVADELGLPARVVQAGR